MTEFDYNCLKLLWLSSSVPNCLVLCQAQAALLTAGLWRLTIQLDRELYSSLISPWFVSVLTLPAMEINMGASGGEKE